MKIGIHQPHYFPWLGYMDKMAKSDKFIILDDVQLTDRSPMVRNKFLQVDGTEIMIGLSVKKHGYREKAVKEIELAESEKVQEKHRRFFQLNYNKTKGYKEVYPFIQHIFEKKYKKLIDIEMDTVNAIRELLGITTPLLYQSSLKYDKESKKSDLMLSLCESAGASVYLSGQGAKKYMVDKLFLAKGIEVEYQTFNHPIYAQTGVSDFVPNLSAIDLLMQVGVEDARKIFWENISQ